MQIHLAFQNQKYGPYTADQIKAELEAGRLSPAGMLAWYEGCADWIPLAQVPGLGALPMPQVAPIEEGDATGGLIPYKNPLALASYYVGIGALIPLLGAVAAIVSIVLGVKGIRHYRANPATRGIVHAWVGIGLSSLSLLVHGAVMVAIIVAVAAKK